MVNKWLRNPTLGRIIFIVLTTLCCILVIISLQITEYKSIEHKSVDSSNKKVSCLYTKESSDTFKVKPKFLTQSPKDGLEEALIYYKVHHEDIVYAQAILETGHFKSRVCLEYNNLFGLYNSRKKQYYRFNHWSESVMAYKNWIQRRYKPSEDYYIFLDRIKYAESVEYIPLLKKIVNKRKNDKRRYIKGNIRA